MKSKIYLNEKKKNKNRQFNELLEYYPCYIDNDFALFTENEIMRAIERGKKHPEDIPKQSIFDKLIGGINR
jgi:hypothetical protein